MDTEILSYDKAKYDFAEIIRRYLDVNDLSLITSGLSDKGREGNSLYKNMEQTPTYRKLYDRLLSDEGKSFYSTYRNFIKEIIRPQYDEPIYFQEKPTHRLLYRDLLGIERFHKDTDYGHNPREINYSVPQTDTFGTNAIWIESAEGKQDFEPIEMKVGEYAKFHGSILEHGAKTNLTDSTRISFDFRVIKASDRLLSEEAGSDNKEPELADTLFRNAHQFILCP